jgi:hypothetical protein
MNESNVDFYHVQTAQSHLVTCASVIYEFMWMKEGLARGLVYLNRRSPSSRTTTSLSDVMGFAEAPTKHWLDIQWQTYLMMIDQ